LNKLEKIVAIIQARMGSERLSGKVLKKISGKPLLEHIISRIATSKKIHNVIVATSDKIEDRPIINLSKRLSFPYFAGSEHDVLSRFIGAGRAVSADIVVRICGDNPLIDVEYLDDMIDSHILKNAEYTCNDSPIPIGTAGEVVDFSVLESLDAVAKEQRYREHVTTYILEHLEEFKVNRTEAPSYLKDKSFRLTVDTTEDLKLIRTIYRKLYSDGKIIKTSHAIAFLENNPSLSKINIHIPQKDWRLK
jgi:spore coat polysaccharide biosynthesis protein SpsF